LVAVAFVITFRKHKFESFCIGTCTHKYQEIFLRNLNNSKNGKLLTSLSFILHIRTELCKDSTDDDFSDTDSSKTEGYAVVDVVEYELASTSADDDEDNSSISSGTEEIATTAFYEFNALIGRHNEISDVDSDDFILADTEDDTDGSIDLELGQADYWKCVKCNNKQNNPLYRYCEKCYQVSEKDIKI
jgi:hypothetical protein